MFDFLKVRLAGLYIALVGLCFAAPAISAETLDTGAPMAFLMEVKTGSVLYAKAADKTFQPAGLSRIMTAATVFKALKDGKVTEVQECKVSEHAWRTGGAPAGGTTMFAELGSFISVLDLLKGLLVHQAQDAAIILAECLDGDETTFAARMTAYGREIGLTNSRFLSPAGFDVDGATTTAEDMATLGLHMLQEFPDQYPLFALSEFTWNDIYQRNRNPLIDEMRGLDGLGTGSSEKGGFASLASLERDGRRVIAVVAGSPSAKARIQALKQVVDGAWDYFSVRQLYSKGDVVAMARVFGGIESEVPLVAERNIAVLLPKTGALGYKLRVTYSGPVVAPVEPGKRVGELRVFSGDRQVHQVGLLTGGKRIEKGDLLSRAKDSLGELLFGWL